MAAAPLPNFEEAIVPHLHAAYSLARWITRNPHDAEDLAQESYLKAFRFFAGFQGVDGRGWLLAITRNTCLTWLKREAINEAAPVFDERIHSTAYTHTANAEEQLLARLDAKLLRECIDELPHEYRDVLVMRELKEMSYKEIAGAARVPMGTIMSRLSRGRKQLEIVISHRLSARLA